MATTEMDTAARHAQYEKDTAEFDAGLISLDEYLARFRAMQKPQTSDSTDLIREDRDDPDR